MSWTFGIFCSTNPLLTEKDYNVQNCWAKAKHSPKYGHWFWLSHIQNGIFGHFTLRLSCLHSLMFLSCSRLLGVAMPISVSVNIHDFWRSNFLHDLIWRIFLSLSSRYFTDKERANEEGCGENDQGGEESTGVTAKISRILPANTVLVDPAAPAKRCTSVL